MSSNENGAQQPAQVTSAHGSADDDSSISNSESSNGIVMGDFDDSDTNSSTANQSRPATIPLTARQQNSPPHAVPMASTARHMLSPNSIGFMTPPATTTGIPNRTGASYVVSPPRRKSSSISPGEASLNSLELEAIAAVHELQFAVKDIYVSEMLPRTSELIFLNVTTLEGQAYCVELTIKGWRVTSLRHDCMNGDINHLDLHVQYFETIYALMDRISPAYRRRFTDALMSKLAAIQAERQDEPDVVTTKSAQVNDENESQDRLELEQRQTFT